MRNGCAQRALASVLGVPARDVHARHPPDTPFALLGTTPWGFERMARAEGLDARRIRGEAALRAAFQEGGDVIVLVDVRRLLGAGLGYHWALARPVPGGLALDARVASWPAFRRAWRSWMPGAYREAALHVRRRSAKAATAMRPTPAATPSTGTTFTAEKPDEATPNVGS